jgi:hypothetical protein
VNSIDRPSGESWGSETERRWNRSALARPALALGGGTGCCGSVETCGDGCVAAWAGIAAAAWNSKAARAAARRMFSLRLVIGPPLFSPSFVYFIPESGNAIRGIGG